MTTTQENITIDQCIALAKEAQAAGDDKMANIAKHAATHLAVGDRFTMDVSECARVIREAEAQS